jgi:tRNA A37 threonylcarbamoyladenosine modification protein TsaB|tara:strand:+ start:3444 stop:3827 length:384 start_codon:yes stop_codon:yes gene_type:complete
MIKDFLILNCIGKDDKIGLKVNTNFFIHEFNKKVKNNDLLVINILNFVKKHKVILDKNFSILINNGPGSFSSIRVALAVAKGIELTKNINLFGFKNSDLKQFNLVNIELLIKNKLIEKKLIKPLYLS